ncbi:MAG: DNA mismatch repair endonuclease MutL [Anaerolineales bacterium]|nr:DNA mismatch repair endonuclease MutL [Anaerolineales bacterium]
MAIELLSPEVASQIAAGEVVERPASVVKELLENALDAGARQVTITIEGAGRRVVEVADDGSGIPAEELSLAVERHATSKLRSAADLFHIATLGFRGEALASIGSVARLTITSRPANTMMGARLRVEGGEAMAVQPVGTAVGTVVRVENLFYNVPARLKFLKQEATERRAIDTLVTHYALAYPQVRFHLYQEGRPALLTSGNGERREVLAALYGVDVARQMLEVLSEDEGLKVTGFISPTSLTRSNRREITFYVNGRPVQDSALMAALVQAYHTMLMVGRYPLAFLFLELPPEMVDVNVHPTKAEVRFRESDGVFRGVQRAVRRGLLAHTPIPQIGEQLQWRPGTTSMPGSGGTSLDWEFAVQGERNQAPEMTLPPAQPLQPALSPPAQADGRPPLLRLVGQIASAYLVAEGPDGLYLIDQHAAHERVLFERFSALRKEQTGEIPSQSLLEPLAVELPPASTRMLDEQLPLLNGLGFSVEPFGHNTYLVRAIPVILSGMDPAAALAVLVEDFEENEAPLQSEIEAKMIARICKRAAVKAGHVLSPQEQRALLTDLEACQSPRTCPHGRPTMIHLSVDLLERQFGRRGAR